MEAWNGPLVAGFIGVVYLVLGYPLYKGRVKPNRAYGFRIGETLNDPEIWYRVNARSGRHFLVTGTLLVALGLLAIPLAASASQQDLVMWASLAICALGTLYSGVAGYRMAKSLAGERAQDRT